MVGTALGGVMVGLSSSLPPLFILTKAGCIALGVGLVFHAIMRLRYVPGGRNNHEHIGPILLQILLGALLVQLDTVVAAGAESIFNANSFSSSSPLAYKVRSDAGWVSDRATNILTAILSFVQFVGYVSVARGIIELNRVANGQALQGVGIGKGLTHVIGGILASNIMLTVQMLGGTFFGGTV